MAASNDDFPIPTWPTIIVSFPEISTSSSSSFRCWWIELQESGTFLQNYIWWYKSKNLRRFFIFIKVGKIIARICTSLSSKAYILLWIAFMSHYSLLLRQIHSTLVAYDSVWGTFYSAFLNIHQSGVLTQHCLVVIWLVPHETAAVSEHVLWTPYNHAPVYSVTSFKASV